MSVTETPPAHVSQPGIQNNPPELGCYLLLNAQPQTPRTQALSALRSTTLSDSILDGALVVGFGARLMQGADAAIGYKTYDASKPQDPPVPANQADLALWLCGKVRGELLHLSHTVINSLSGQFSLVEATHSFTFRRRTKASGTVAHDLSGFEDGTENPSGEKAQSTALIQSPTAHLNGGSLWTLQRWQHDFEWLRDATVEVKKQTIGRSLKDNHELPDNVASAHIMRTEQESFSPEAHMLRRSMPWCDDRLRGGLMFSCFAHSLYPFEAQLNRMCGGEDGIQDRLFRFAKILGTGFYWCPPITSDGTPNLV
jgi:putative iron-dependent peroxidase